MSSQEKYRAVAAASRQLSSVEAFRAAFTQELSPGDQVRPIRFDLRGGCDCGCGSKPRLEIVLGDLVSAIADPIQIDALVDLLADGRVKLWGPRPAKGGGG